MGTISFRVSKAERAMRDIAEGRNLVYYKEDLSPAVARKLEAVGLIVTEQSGDLRRAFLTAKGRQWLSMEGTEDTVKTVAELARENVARQEVKP